MFSGSIGEHNYLKNVREAVAAANGNGNNNQTIFANSADRFEGTIQAKQKTPGKKVPKNIKKVLAALKIALQITLQLTGLGAIGYGAYKYETTGGGKYSTEANYEVNNKAHFYENMFLHGSDRALELAEKSGRYDSTELSKYYNMHIPGIEEPVIKENGQQSVDPNGQPYVTYNAKSIAEVLKVALTSKQPKIEFENALIGAYRAMYRADTAERKNKISLAITFLGGMLKDQPDISGDLIECLKKGSLEEYLKYETNYYGFSEFSFEDWYELILILNKIDTTRVISFERAENGKIH